MQHQAIANASLEQPQQSIAKFLRSLDRGIEGGVEEAYARSLPLAEAMRDEVLLAYEMNGAPLLPQHGFPLRLLVPGWYGMTNVKWLAEIELAGEPLANYQMARAYRLRATEHEEGTPIDRMLPRALLAPPGVPEYFSRARRLRAGPCTLAGRAWSGKAPSSAGPWRSTPRCRRTNTSGTCAWDRSWTRWRYRRKRPP